MRLSSVLILIACITVITVIYLCYKNRKNIKTKNLDVSLIFGLTMLTLTLYGIIAIVLAALSIEVTTINGGRKSDCITKRYFLFYSANGLAKESNTVFLMPFGKDVIFNNTNAKLVSRPIVYGEIKKHYEPVLLQPRTITKVKETPEYFFEPVPDQIMYKSRYSSSGRVYWAIVRAGESLRYTEPFKWMNKN